VRDEGIHSCLMQVTQPFFSFPFCNISHSFDHADTYPAGIAVNFKRSERAIVLAQI